MKSRLRANRRKLKGSEALLTRWVSVSERSTSGYRDPTMPIRRVADVRLFELNSLKSTLRRMNSPRKVSVYRLAAALLGAPSTFVLIHSSIAGNVLALSFALNRIRFAESSNSRTATGAR